MSRRKRTAASPPPARSGPPGRDLGAAVAAFTLAAAVAAGALAVDPTAEAAFDAPKRLLMLVGVVATVLVLCLAPHRVPTDAASGPSRAARAALLLLLAALGGAVLSALASPRRAIALEALRTVALFALLLPLGASRALADGGRRVVVVAFLAACGLNAALSLAQAMGVMRPFAVEALPGRANTGALAGNEGHLALAIALASVVTLVVALHARSGRVRAVAVAVLALFFVCLAVNASLTAVSAAGAGILVVLAIVFRRRMLLPAAVAMVVAAALVASVAPLRGRVKTAVAAARSGDWDSLTTYRLGPWAAALEMARGRPLLGFGPGTFEAEFVPQRLAAELRYSRRFLNPTLFGHYGQAHSEPLQAAAEAGLLSALAAAGAFIALLIGLRRPHESSPAETAVLAGVLTAGAVASLTWFPLQVTITAAPLLLAAGRAWRIAAGPSRLVPERWKSAASVLAALAVVLALAPELTRYRRERELRGLVTSLRSTLSPPLPDAAGRLRWIAGRAEEVAGGMRCDARPLMVAGSARLALRDAAGATLSYRTALLCGERAETDLNLGRAHMLGGDRSAATAYLLRAGWISPAMLTALPAEIERMLLGEIARLEALLRQRRLSAPPPLPPH